MGSAVPISDKPDPLVPGAPKSSELSAGVETDVRPVLDPEKFVYNVEKDPASAKSQDKCQEASIGTLCLSGKHGPHELQLQL